MRLVVRALVMASLFALELVLAPIFVCAALVCRFRDQPIDVGLGPEPLINNIYHRRALRDRGFSAETFVGDVYFITDDFDVRGDLLFEQRLRFLRPRKYLKYGFLFLLSIWRYRCVYIYFNGGPLGLVMPLLAPLEPYLYRLARVKIVVMPYGGDVQDMSRSSNLLFKDALARDYREYRLRRPGTARRVDRWTKHASHVISGCDWVEYMYHWDTLMLAHFSIDLEAWQPAQRAPRREGDPIRILHAPNHRNIKGTRYFVEAVNELAAEGLPVELVLLERVPNQEVKRVMASVDIVADQLVVGWYAMFALEAMAMEKPVLCYLRDEFTDLYVATGLLCRDEVPIVSCSPLTVKETIRELVLAPERLPEIGRRSREFVERHHSLEAVGKVFEVINRSLGIAPSTSERVVSQAP